MIKSIKLKNYRCFKDTILGLKDISILVGKNNAGKSTLIEALRLVALASRKSDRVSYKNLPQEFDLPSREHGFRLDVDSLKIDLRSIVNEYEDTYACITTFFDDNSVLYIYANTLYAYAVIHDSDGNCIKYPSKAKKLDINYISIMPPLGLIKETEQLLSKDTVEKDRNTYLFSRHFRNEIYLYKEIFWDDFTNLSYLTWEGLRINDIELNEERIINLYIYDKNFCAELGLMGSGLQMWLQIMWFLARTKTEDTIILDEPDVYMHPDLQRKLIRLIQDRYKQVIIATHSVEIISEVEPKSIVTVDKSKKHLSYASDLIGVQIIIDDLEEINNLSLVRLGSTRKCIFVEGKDIKLLSKIEKIVFGSEKDSLETLPCVSLGGFANLKESFGTAKLFYKETNGAIKCFCILDRDYYPKELIEEKHNQALNNYLNLHIWKRKEIENYLIEPQVLFRLTKQSNDKYNDFLIQLDKLLDSFKEEVFAKHAEQLYLYNKKQNFCDSVISSSKYINLLWDDIKSKIMLVPGKKVLKRINDWFSCDYNVHLSIDIILSEFKEEDFDEEIIEVIRNIML